MQKQSTFTLAAILGVSIAAIAGDSADGIKALEIVSSHQAHFIAPPRKFPSNCSTDAPLLGNGDFLAALAGPPEKLLIPLSKADLWELRADAGPRALGTLEIELPELKGAGYHVTQDLLHATTTGTFAKDGRTLEVETAIAATENLMWVKLTASGGEFAGSAVLRGSDEKMVPSAVDDNDGPANVGREGFGGGRYHFDGEIADVRVSPNPLAKPANIQPGNIKSFDAKSPSRELVVPRMDKAVNVDAWIKINRTGEANYIVSKGEWNKAYSLGLSGGCLRWSINGTYIQTGKPLEAGKWLHVAGTFDGRAMRIFIDGQMVAENKSEAVDGIQVIERRYEKGVSRPTGAACALHVPGGKASVFTVSPGKPVILFLAVSGMANTKEFRGDAVRRATQTTEISLAALQKTHVAWWANFWAKSFVEIPDKVLEQRYYLAHYGMASASRVAHFPPALYGWTLSEGTPMWGGAYFNNYNFFAPFYGLYAANHVEQAMPCNDAVIDALELGREWAKDEAKYEKMCGNSLKIKDAPGILLPVSMLPHGLTGAPTTWGQRTNASYACVPLASTWYATYDPGFAKRAYPFVREVATFWEHYLVLENGRYVDRNDAVLENSGRDTNPIVALAMIRQVLALAIDMGTALGVDAGRHAKWRDILARLSDYPICTVGDLPAGSRVALPDSPVTRALPIFRYSEMGCAWQNDNAVGIQHIFPGNGIGLGVRPDLLDRARNQIKVMARWIDLNGCNSFYPAAVRVGHDPTEILKHLRHWVDTASPNGMRADNPHGTEQFSVVPTTIQEMLLQSFDGTLRFFPNWPRDLDARFGTLRARGAFLVSADLKGGVISGVKITSEKGLDCTIVNPWPGKSVRVIRAGKEAETVADGKFTFKTAIAETIGLEPE